MNSTYHGQNTTALTKWMCHGNWTMTLAACVEQHVVTLNDCGKTRKSRRRRMWIGCAAKNSETCVGDDDDELGTETPSLTTLWPSLSWFVVVIV